MQIRIPNVTLVKTKNSKVSIKIKKWNTKKIFPSLIGPASSWRKKTSDNWLCASESAHNLKYEAVFEIVPKRKWSE